MSRIWWQYTDWDSDNIAVWPPDQLPNYCTIFRSAWINQWLGWKYYIHGHYPPSTSPSAFAYPYRVAREYNFPDSPGIAPANGFGVWSPADYAEWNRRVANGEQHKNTYVLEHTLGKQYLPTGMDGEGNVQLGVEDHRFAWWNPSGIPNITGVNHGTLREYVDHDCLRTSFVPISVDYSQSVAFWRNLVNLNTAGMNGLPVSEENGITVPGDDDEPWGTFDDHDFNIGAFEAPWTPTDEYGGGQGTLPGIPSMDVYCAGWFYPNTMWNLQGNSLRRFLLLMRTRFDAAGAFGTVFQGSGSAEQWTYNESAGEWRNTGNRTAVSPEIAYRGFQRNGWRIQSYFIDPDYTNPNPGAFDVPDNTLRNVIWGTDTNFNYALVSFQNGNHPAGGSAPFPMPDEKWYCHDIIDFSESGTTLDSKLHGMLGTASLGSTHGLPGNDGDFFDYGRQIMVVQYPRKKLPPDFRSFDQPLGVSAPAIWGPGE